LHLHPEIEEFLRIHKKKALRGLMWKNFVHIKVLPDSSIPRDKFEFYTIPEGINVTNALDMETSTA
jgi:hypothetical protein